MNTHIAIDWISGRPQRGAEDDERRAIEAAEASLAASGVPATQASADYRRQWLTLGDEARMTGAALAWIAAGEAANIALTEGWHDPNGAHCSIDLR